MPGELVIRIPGVGLQTDSLLPKLMQNTKSIIEGIRAHMKNSVEERLVVSVITQTMEHVPKKFKKPELQNQVTIREIHVAKTNTEAAEKSYNGWEKIIGKEEKERRSFRRVLKPSKGEYDQPFKRIVINLQEIRRNCNTDSEIEASIILTTIHEYLHSIENFGTKIRYNGKMYETKFLTEGVTEYFAREIMKELYPNEYENLCSKDLQEYANLIEEVMTLEKIIGRDVLIEAFLSGNFFLIERRINELSASKEFELILARLKKKKKLIQEDDGESTQKNTSPKTNSETAARTNIFQSASIDEVRRVLGPGREELSPRMALMATIFHLWCMKNENPTPLDIAATVSQTLERFDNIPAHAEQELARKITETLGNAASSYQFNVSVPNATKQCISPSRDNNNPIQFAKPVNDARNLTQAIDLKFGEDVNFDTANLVQIAVLNHTLSNAGRLPKPEQVLQIIYKSYLAAGCEKYVMPDAQIVADQIIVDTTRYLQETSLPKDMDWVRKTLMIACPKADLSDPQNIFNQVYQPQSSEVICEINQISDFGTFAPAITETAATFLSQQGIRPTNGDVYGLVVSAFEVAKQSGLIEYFNCMESGLPEHNPAAEATLNVIRDINRNMRTRNIQSISNTPAFVDMSNSIQQYWGQKSNNPVQVDSLSSATQTFISLLEFRHPAEIVGFDRCAGIIRMTPDGKRQLPEAVDYSVSANIVGATNCTEDLRLIQKRRPNAAKTETGTMGNFEPIHYTKPLLIEEISDPFKLTPEIVEISRKISMLEDPVKRMRKLFDILKRNGEIGINASVFIEDRTTGSLAPEDVLKHKIANCLELTILFVLAAEKAFEHDKKARVIALDVINSEQRVEIPHACVGVLLESAAVAGHPRFDSDWNFRASVLSRLGIDDNPKLKLLVIDPVNNIFDYRFHNIRPLDKKMAISMFYSNSGAYNARRGDKLEARKNLSDSLSLWAGNPFAAINYAILHAKNNPKECFNRLNSLDTEYKNSHVHGAMAQIALMYMDDYAKTMECLEKAYRLDASNRQVIFMKSVLHASNPDEKNLRKAMIFLNQFIKIAITERRQVLDQLTASVTHGKGIDLLQTKTEKEDITQEIIIAYRILGLINLILSDLDGAVKVVEQARTIYPDDAQIQFIAGFSYLAISDTLSRIQMPDHTYDRIMKKEAETHLVKAEQIFNRFSNEEEGFEVNIGKAVIEKMRGKQDKCRVYLDKARNNLSTTNEQGKFYSKMINELNEKGLFDGQDISTYIRIFQMIKAAEFNPIRKNMCGHWLHVDHESRCTLPAIQVDNLENLSAPAPNAGNSPIHVIDKKQFLRIISSSTHLKTAFDRYHEVVSALMQVLNSSLGETEKAVLVHLIRNVHISEDDVTQCAYIWFSRVLGRTSATPHEGRTKAAEIKYTLIHDPLSLDPRLLNELTKMAQRHIPTEDEILGFTKEVLTQFGKPDTPENIRAYLPHVKKMSCNVLNPFGRLRHLEIRVRNLDRLA